MQLAKKYPVSAEDRIAAAEVSIQSPIQKSKVVTAADLAIDSSYELVFITKAGACAITLAAPVAGDRSAGGDDGKELAIVSTTAFAHTVTTPSNKINTNKAVATMTAAIGNSVEFYAFNGVWYMRTQIGVTLS